MQNSKRWFNYSESLQDDWIVRRYDNGIVKRYKYIGVFVPGEPFLAVYYDVDADDIFTAPVYAFVVRVVQYYKYHDLEFLPVVAGDDRLDVDYSDIISNYVGVVPARLYEEMHDELLKAARSKYEAREKAEQK
ncbi:MAG: hypothetical protein JHC26_06220 [Thermofilum sp.]|uniref:hypothetical protein n=1 Tax=Thermofilum sp. TaxID=1961369 RepID=UPI0025888E5E|nr:hypothetical protein [Thermofilum sp.]MCI4408667.1 hypothetical protein [Thermofilum sp.]